MVLSGCLGFSLLLLMSLNTGVSSGRLAPFYKTRDSIKDHYIVVLKENALQSSVLETLRSEAHKLGVEFTVNRRYDKVLNGFSATLSKRAVEMVRANTLVKYVEEDGLAFPAEIWGLDRINQRDLPLDNSFTPVGNGSGVHVYVLDTGIRTTHEEFEDRAEFVYDAVHYAEGIGGDCQGHGTHCAGTVAGKRYGVAKAARVYAVRVLGCGAGYGSWAGIIDGMNWVATNGRRPAVASMSIVGGGVRGVDEALGALHRSGITVVVAGGNLNIDACDGTPARAPEAMTVGVSDVLDNKAYFSSWGACIDIFAPGSNVLSAGYRSDTEYRYLSGTSMATPHVAGVAAIHLGLNPQLTPKELHDIILNDASRDKIGDIRDSENLLLYVPG